MGVAIKDLILAKETSLEDLNNKILFVDSFNLLYQFLTTIRDRSGKPLMDSSGNITSHLVGLFSRVTKMMQKNIKLAFVFDGEPPALKKEERQRRAYLKKKAMQEYETAKDKEDIEGMKKFAARTAKLTEKMVEDAKNVVSALGLPVIQAPSEGEAQAAFMAKNKDGFAVLSQDFDSLVHGAPKLVRNLSLLGKRKRANTTSYDTIKPELIDLAENLNKLGIDQNQLIAMAMLVGTDYNIGGIKGIGPKNALKLVKKHRTDFDALFEEVKWQDYFDFEWSEVYYTIKKIKVKKNYDIKFRETDEKKLREILVEQHDFSIERVNNALKEIQKGKDEKKQKGLTEFFK